MAASSFPIAPQGAPRSRIPKVREASFRDYPKIAALASRLLSIEPYQEWEHLWVNNPVYKRSPGVPIGWVVEQSGEIVGYTGNILFDYELRGRRLAVALPRAWITDDEYRSYSILLLERCFSQVNVDLFLGTTANDKGSSAMQAMGASLIPVPIDDSVFWITDAGGFAASALRLRSVPFSSLLRWPVAGVLFANSILRRKFPSSDDSRVQFTPSFDERFSDFWEELRIQNSHTLLASRSVEALRWHFLYALREHRAWILTLTEGAKLVAYAVFQRADVPQIGLKRMRLVDFQSLAEDGRTLTAMLTKAEKRCRAENLHMLEICVSNLTSNALVLALAPYRRKTAVSPFFYMTRDPELANQLKDPGVWCPSLYDGDMTIGR